MCRRAGLVVLLAMAGPACGRTAGQVVSTVTLSRPHTLDGLFTTRDGVLYGAGAWNSDEVVRIEPDGDVAVVARGLRGPIHGAEDAHGRLWVTNFMDGTVSRIDPRDGSVETVATGLDGPSGIAIDSTGRVYVANWGRAGSGGTVIHRILPDGTLEEFVRGRGVNTPIGLAFDEAGMLYVANAVDGTIHRIDSEGTLVEPIARLPRPDAPPRPALGHMVYRAGHLIVTGNFRHVVYDVSTKSGEVTILAGIDNEAGASDGSAPAALLTVPNGLALSPDGRTLWVAQGGGGVDQSIRRIELAGEGEG